MSEPTDASSLKPGDKVRLTMEATVGPDGQWYRVPYSDGIGAFHVSRTSTKILVVERMPEPLPTLIGAVIEAQCAGRVTRKRLVRVLPYPNPFAWFEVAEAGITAHWMSDPDLTDVVVLHDGWDGTP